VRNFCRYVIFSPFVQEIRCIGGLKTAQVFNLWGNRSGYNRASGLLSYEAHCPVCPLPPSADMPDSTADSINLPNHSRRRFGLVSAAVTAGALLPLSPALQASGARRPELSVSLHNLHTDERLSTVFWSDGHYNPESLREINWLLRDHRTGDVKFIDPRLLSILYLTNLKIGNSRPVHIISGYRSPKTNQMLAKRSSGVAKNSYHMRGRAIDLRIPGVQTTKIRDIGVHLGVGGVGYYPTSDFIHIDTGPKRQWQGR
jgi:uncharacterized protein YcbK (DUF882 family)